MTLQHLRCMNCARAILEGEEYKLELPSGDPVCKRCWLQYEKWLTEIEATDDLLKWENQEVLVR